MPMEDALMDEAWTLGKKPSVKHLKAIGELIVAFAQLDETIATFMSLLLGDEPELVSILAHSLTSSERCNALRDICAYRLGYAEKIRAHEVLTNDEQLQELNNLFSKVEDAIKRRNRVVHSTWAGSPSDITIAHRLRWTKQKQKPGWPNADYSLVTIDDLKSDTEFINKVDSDLWSFCWGKFGGWIQQRFAANVKSDVDS